MSLAYIKDDRNHWTVVVNNKSYQFDPSNKFYDKLVECIKNDDATYLVNMLEKGRLIVSWSYDNFKIEDGVLKYQDETVSNVLAERALEIMEGEFDYLPILNFIKNLYDNMSMRAIEELYKFLEHKHLPITPDGCFVAYKGVSIYNNSGSKDKLNRDLIKGDLVDKYTGVSYRNNVGDVNTMVRRHVNDDANVGCAQGLHVGSFEYASDYAGSEGQIVLCKVNPSDVVSVPYDSDCQKVRVAKYEVIGIYEKVLQEPVYNYEQTGYDEDGDLEDPYEGDGWNE